MAITPYQVKVLRLLAEHRKRKGCSYVAGGLALNQILAAPRLSQDIDVFHDTTAALQASWVEDRQILQASGHSIEVIREAPAFVEATVSQGEDQVLIQWMRDSAFRFFPLIEHDLFGFTLHPLDLATNKILALAGRLEPRDWVDMIECHQKLQPLGYLAWAASGKDPGVNPDSLLTDAARLRYSQAELDGLAFDQSPPSAAALSRVWKACVAEGRTLVAELPADQVGKCLLFPDGTPYNKDSIHLIRDIQNAGVLFHPGSIGGAWPHIIEP